MYFPLGCEPVLSHICNPCPQSEGGRIRGLGFIKTSYTFTDVSNPVEWMFASSQGLAAVLPNTSGVLDITPIRKKRIGDLVDRIIGYDFKINAIDPNFIGNCSFYNFLSDERNFRVAWITESIMQVSDVAVNVTIKDPIKEIETERVFELEIIWSQRLLACHNQIPNGIFDCVTFSGVFGASFDDSFDDSFDI